ncbi:MAG: hypothetical protein IT372_13680 [Polyangiaceae bacterium]|nr:hypothetical protein [Polyangiaceae bacterium]
MASTDAPAPPRLVQLVRDYATFLRLEPRARGYIAGAMIDDIGIAVSGWAATLMATNLAETQRARATLMIPALVCFLLGTLISGPLADWFAQRAPAELARWRWKVVLAGRAVETALLAVLVLQLAIAPPTIARVLPYVMVTAFMKTALRSTRIAFSVDLLREETTPRGPDGNALLDERGAPLRTKSHLVQFLSLSSMVSTVALLIGLLVGGQVMGLVGGRAWILFAIDVLTNLGFLAVVYAWCAPPRSDAPAEPAPAAEQITRFRHFWRSFADGFRFLALREQRPLLALLAGSFLVEVINEAYEGKMVIKHVLGGGDDAIRYAEISWTLVAIVGAGLLPLVLHRAERVGRLFLIAMLLDGAVIALAGRVAGAAAPSAVIPFAVLLGVDGSLTLVSTTLTQVAQNSVSSAAMRGRIAGSYAIVVIVGDMLSQGLATLAEDRVGIPGLILRAGVLQVGLVACIAIAGGRRLWRFGLRAEAPAAAGALGLPARGEVAS